MVIYMKFLLVLVSLLALMLTTVRDQALGLNARSEEGKQCEDKLLLLGGGNHLMHEAVVCEKK